jgi:DNA-binding NarL/FixJ family response regulator
MHPEHGAEDLCAAGTTLYERALREGRVSGAEAEAAPCLIDLNLLRPASTDVNRQEPVAPAVVLHRLRRNAEDRILRGTEQINSAVTTAMAEAAQEALCIQPNTHYRGCRIRTLYQHTQRHIPLVTARYERLRGDAQARTLDGVTPRQRAIAALLIEGHTDAVIAERLGMNIRTAREHIAKLAATLGSESQAQLGCLIGESGILKQVGEAE